MQRSPERSFHEDRGKRPRTASAKVVLPIFEPSGLLELESHNQKGIQLKHVEPSAAESPKAYWTKLKIPLRNRIMFQAVVYKKGQKSPFKEYSLDLKSCYVIGRGMGRSLKAGSANGAEDQEEVVIADIPIPEESCSKQHCVIQFQKVDGKLMAYVMDLDSSNGTTLNGVSIPRARYVELRSGDVLMPSDEEDTDFEIVFLAV